jgi:eukaryotic-like serine/threonine-protein kinase
VSLVPGSHIGHYQIIGPLGEGGMGLVYRGRDTRLNRDVAIKALQASVASDPERIARFEREAQLLASLHHANIAGIYGLEQADGATYLVLEFVAGRPLDAVLKSDGPFAPADAVVIARQIADAIAAAHDKGIIHRDLKPGNVMLTADGGVKVLDFGLGKSLDDGHAASGSSASNSPTITFAATQAGLILGTAGYMSPEQAKGRTADRRSDVWSFGCVLFELLTGRRAFEGEDVTDTIAAVVRGEPNLAALPASTPPALRHLIERTLIKDRNQRLPDMSVVRYILNEPGILGPAPATGATAVTAPPAAAMAVPERRSRLWMVAALVSTAAAIILAVFDFGDFGSRTSTTSTAGASAPAHFTIVLPDDTEVGSVNEAPLAIAPDGHRIAFPAVHAGRTLLDVYDVATGDTRAIDGTDDARSPFFSPDGRWIGFFARGKLKKVTVGGASLQEIANAPDARGGSWSTDDAIYYAPTNTSGLSKVAASGGAAVEVTRLDAQASEISHRYPHVLADGQALLFMAWTGPGLNEHRIEYLTLADGKRQVVARNADGPPAVVGGRLFYSGRQDTLLSAPWSPSHPNLEGVEPTALPIFAAADNEGAGAYAVAANGTIVRLSGSPTRRLAKIVWVDRGGTIDPLPLPDRDYVSAAISPDGTRAAIQTRGDSEDIWIYDFGTKSFTPLVTPGGSSQAPVWTTDSKFVVYRGTRQGTRNLYRKAVDGSGDEERLTTRTAVVQTPTSATPDGKGIVYIDAGANAGQANGVAGRAGLWNVSLDGAHETVPIAATPGVNNNGQISPDGRWLSFESNVTGRFEIWVEPFNGPAASTGGATRQVSRDGGIASRWARDGHELYFMVGDGLMAVTVTGGAFSAPRPFVTGRYRHPANANSDYDVARDGRLLHVLPIEPSRPNNRIEVVLNGVK